VGQFENRDSLFRDSGGDALGDMRDREEQDEGCDEVLEWFGAP